MGISNRTQRQLRKFVASLADKSLDDLPFERASDAIMGSIPVGVETTEDKIGYVTLSGTRVTLYRECLESLTSEPETEHLERNELDRDLWELACDLLVNQMNYRQQGPRKVRLEQFLSAVTKPHEDFEVISAIDGLAIGEGEITIGKVTFSRFDNQRAVDWVETKGLMGNFPPGMLDQTVGLSPEQAGSFNKAIERANESIDTALNILRVCMASSHHPFTLDEQLLLKRSGLCVAKPIDPQSGFHVEWRRGFDGMGAELDKQKSVSIAKFAAKVQPLYDGTVPERLALRLLRALEWIGTSITREHHDDKVVDLCTALECLLTSKDDGAKGEAITLRIMLLARALNLPWPNPARIYGFYELRSDVVHGSAWRVCAQSDYLELRYITLYTLLRVLDFILQDSSITQPNFLIEALERESAMEHISESLSEYKDESSRKMAKYVRERLKH